jgi:hypothetical protein
MKDERLCRNCRAPLPAGAAWCEACGTDSGDVFDGRVQKPQSSSRGILWALLILIVIAGAGFAAWTYRSKIPLLRPKPVFDTGPVRVVGQRPGGARRPAGAKLSEPEAMMTLRHELAPQVKSECLAIASRGYREGAYSFDAVDSCGGTKLGRYKVDGTSGKITR